MAKIPKTVEKYLDENLLFNKFGIVNLAKVKFESQTTLSDEELKVSIIARFGKEMANEEIEFI